MSKNLNDLMCEKWEAMSEDERKTWTMQRGLFPELCEILQPREDESCAEGAARVVAERENLAALVRQLIRLVKRTAPVNADTAAADRAQDYLNRIGMGGSILR